MDARLHAAVQSQGDAGRGEAHEDDIDEHRLQEFGARLDDEGEDGGDADEVAYGREVGGEIVGLEESDGDGRGEGAFEHEFEAGPGDAGGCPEGFASLCERGFLLRRAIVVVFGFAA